MRSVDRTSLARGNPYIGGLAGKLRIRLGQAVRPLYIMHIRAQLCVGRVVRSWRTCHPWPLCVDYIWYGFPKRDKGESQGGPGKGTTAMFFSYCSASQSSWGASWLAGWLGGLRPGNLSCAWLAGWGAGWLAEAQRGPERPREAERG